MLGWAWCLVMAQIQFSLIKNKDWMSRTLSNPTTSTPTCPITSYFCLLLPPPTSSKWRSYVYHLRSVKQQRVNQPSRPLKKWGPPIWSVFAIGVSGMDLEPKANIKYSLPITVLCALSLSPFRILNCRSNIFWQVISSK